MKNVLIVDDNNRYADNLKSFFESKGYSTDRAFTAKEGWLKVQDQEYHSIVTDITMESQTSGLWFARKVYKSGYKGNLIIATTGFDFPGVLSLGKWFLPAFAGIGWMIPKKPLKQGKVVLIPTNLKKGILLE